ncbi:hypothetical protein [Streptomyces sp. CAI-85]|uniref:hypothetical protein n=1 Tax=Streptomyces sp. CAI-85 TaxID=1472662 RepID=UPI00158789EF|nr:hypothetical protein [Streptomyces sp. CAI-85]NUV64988.1 hypothetical protein [Streptomyces sp. CAI-85]
MTQESTPAELRAAADEALRKPGARRQKIRKQLDEVEAELRPLIVRARLMEVPVRRVTALTGIAPGTVQKWAREAARKTPGKGAEKTG